MHIRQDVIEVGIPSVPLRGWICVWSTPTASVTMVMGATTTVMSHLTTWSTMATIQWLRNWFALTSLRPPIAGVETNGLCCISAHVHFLCS